MEIFLSRSEISALPNDHRVIQMMDFLSQVVVKAQNVCSKHERQPLNFFCKSCLVPVCRDCTVLDHKEQSDHVIVDVAQALTDNSDEFNNIENRSKQLLQCMKSRSDALANASKQLELQERQLRGKIKDTFIEYRLLLERRQESQISMLHELIKKQKSQINTRFVDVCTQGSQLQKLYDSFVKARPSNDITQLFTVHKQIKEREEEFAKQAEANDDELFVGCEFDVINEPIFLSEMSGLGDVTQKPDMNLKNPVPAHQLYVLDMEERRIRESAQDPHPDCDDLMVAGVDPSPHADVTMTSTSRARNRAAELAAERAVLRASRYRTMERERDRDEDEADEREHDANDIVTSEYLLRIASRLTQSSANLSEAILDLSTDRDDSQTDERPSSTTSAHGSGSSRNISSSSRSGRSQNRNVRVVRHPQHYGSSDRSERYLSEAILDLSTDRADSQTDERPSSTSAHRSGSNRNISSSSRSGRSQNRNVNVVRHHQQYGSSDRSDIDLSERLNNIQLTE